MKRPLSVSHWQLWKALVPLGCLLIILAGQNRAQSVEPVRITVDGQQVMCDPPATTRGGRAVAPLRPILEAMGYTVTWEPATRAMSARAGEALFWVQAGSRLGVLGDRAIALPVAPWIAKGAFHAPIAPLAALLGARVGWDAAGRVVSITTAAGPDAQPEPGTGEVTRDRALATATQYLKSIDQYPSTVTEIKARKEQAPANNYWQALVGNGEIISDAPRRPCWIVEIVYEGLNPGSWKHVYVDAESGRVIGGQQSR